MNAPAPRARRPIRPGSYLILLLLFAAVVIPTHLWLIHLPYFWDEAGQFIPAARDLRFAWEEFDARLTGLPG